MCSATRMSNTNGSCDRRDGCTRVPQAWQCSWRKSSARREPLWVSSGIRARWRSRGAGRPRPASLTSAFSRRTSPQSRISSRSMPLPDVSSCNSYLIPLLRCDPFCGCCAPMESSRSRKLLGRLPGPRTRVCRYGRRVQRSFTMRFGGTGPTPEMGLALHRVFVEAGLPEPQLTVDMQMSAARMHVVWPCDLLLSIRAGLRSDEVQLRPLGDLETLAERLTAEARTLQSAVASITVVGAASRPAAVPG
jgi:hypothetical protein